MARQRVVDPRLIGEPDFDPTCEALGEQLGAVGAVKRALLATIAMDKGKDRVAGAVERRAPPTWRRGPIGALAGHDGGATDEQRQDGCADVRARPHAPPALNGSSAARISIARCHRSVRDFASARATTAASSLGTSRRIPCRSGGAWC